MERHVDMQEISDGKKYHSNDMAKLGCNDCEGCSECCRNTGKSIVLDPWDVYMLTTNLKCSFESLLEKYVELNVIEGIILPNLKIEENGKGCHFLSEGGRCKIHGFRPGFCRLFPLGRLYENGTFTYFLQTQECLKERRTKMKISKWLSIPDLAQYEQFVNEWHYFIKGFQKRYRQISQEELKKYNMFLLQVFFLSPYQDGDFYEQFAKRIELAKSQLMSS